jgi:hypothetical protein
MARKKATKARTSQLVFVGNYLEPGVHRVIKAAAKQNSRTLNGEINYRLKMSVKAEKGMQAAE